MKRFILLIGVLSLFSCDKKPSKTVYGAEVSLLNTTPVSLVEAIASETVGQMVRLKSHVVKSCEKKGCWMIIKEGETEVRVTFKDYAFFVPKGFKDSDVILEGVLKKEIISEADRKHFAEDEGQSEAQIAQVVGDETQYTFEAISVLAL